MDFASIMKAQIAKTSKPKDKKETVSETQKADRQSNGNGKYVRRADLEAERIAAYNASQAAIEKARVERTIKRQLEEEEERERIALRTAKKARLAEESQQRREEEARAEEAARRKRLGLPALPEPGERDGEDVDGGEGGSTSESSDDGDFNDGNDQQQQQGYSRRQRQREDVPEDELRLKLREMREPVMLFGESHASRLHRWRRLVTSARRAERRKRKMIQLSTGPTPTTIELLNEDELGLSSSPPSTSPAEISTTTGKESGGQADQTKTTKFVPAKPPSRDHPTERKEIFRQLASYFALVFTEWEKALALRPAAVKDSSSGRQALASYDTARAAMQPLFRLFEKSIKIERRRAKRKQQSTASPNKPDKITTTTKPTKQDSSSLEEDPIPPAVLDGIVDIVHAAQRRRYVAASDAYLTLSIGKAAWPIGVTMVGIHERSAREKLHQGDGGRKAHIMSDESTRKYLQAIKSCLAFAQTRWPPEDHLQLMG